jgi:hydrogenase maturation protease
VSAVIPVRVIGCGNPDAGDDAVGLVAVRLARARLPDDVEVIEAGPAFRVLDLLDGAGTVVVVDALRTTKGARPPGTVVRAEAGPEGLPASVRSSLSSHGFGLAEAVGLAGALGDVPRVVIHGVEAGDVTIGASLSEPVAAAIPALVDAVVADALQEVAR